jgi:hypothetical protein
MVEFGLWVTSQVALRCGQVFHGYDVAQLFGFRANKNERQDHKVTSVGWTDGFNAWFVIRLVREYVWVFILWAHF